MNRRTFLLGLPAAALAMSAPLPAGAFGDADFAPTISLKHLHTGERIETIYRAGERYLAENLARLNRALRDFRTGETAEMDPRLFDLLADLARSVDRPSAQFEIVSGYRSPRTNEMLRRTGGGGVARRSLHTEGRALDVRLPGVSLRRLRDAALGLSGRGGVGYYPGDGFVHIDTGRMREWVG